MSDFSDDELKEAGRAGIKMVEDMMDVVLEGEFLSKCAKVSRKYFEELIKAGFTLQEAVRIVANFNVGGKK